MRLVTDKQDRFRGGAIEEVEQLGFPCSGYEEFRLFDVAPMNNFADNRCCLNRAHKRAGKNPAEGDLVGKYERTYRSRLVLTELGERALTVVEL